MIKSGSATTCSNVHQNCKVYDVKESPACNVSGVVVVDMRRVVRVLGVVLLHPHHSSQVHLRLQDGTPPVLHHGYVYRLQDFLGGRFVSLACACNRIMQHNLITLLGSRYIRFKYSPNLSFGLKVNKQLKLNKPSMNFVNPVSYGEVTLC